MLKMSPILRSRNQEPFPSCNASYLDCEHFPQAPILGPGNRTRTYERDATFWMPPWIYLLQDSRLFALLWMHPSSHSLGNICRFHRQTRSGKVPSRSAVTLVTFSGIITERTGPFRPRISGSLLCHRSLSYLFTWGPRNRGPNLHLVALLMASEEEHLMSRQENGP
jgi:hypothetical protein